MTKANPTSSMILTASLLRELLHYDPISGVFTWHYRHRRYFKDERSYKIWNTKHAGKEAGCVAATGSPPTETRRIAVYKRTYYAHRLAWLYMTGEWPSDEIDHRDHDATNNKWDNLRAATSQQNKWNRRSTNRGGYKGVTFDQNQNCYVAQIMVNYKNHHLGSFATPQDAHAAYCRAALKFFGEFACNT